MKKLLYSLLAIGIAMAQLSCNSSQKFITNSQDYQQYLTPARQHFQQHQQLVKFWTNRLQEQPQNPLYLAKVAGLASRQFRLDGNINAIKKSDSIFKKIIKSTIRPKAGTYLALAQNAITQHNFQGALKFIHQADKIGGKSYETHLLKIDVYLELGNEEMVVSMLQSIDNKHTFDYLIRASKLKDHQGDLAGAIRLMEQAFQRIKNNGQELYCWSLANLGDMYTHDGRPEQAYQAYLKVLKKNPTYGHALKGIAWLTYVYDKKTQDAKNIIHFLQKQKNAPDLYLWLAEIADYEGNKQEKRQNLQKFQSIVSQKIYGAMYDTYRISLAAQEFQNYEQAIRLAQKEVRNRPIAASYALLAWSYLQKGDAQRAYLIVQKQERFQTAGLEPKVLYQLGEIYLANNDLKSAKKYLQQANEEPRN